MRSLSVEVMYFIGLLFLTITITSLTSAVDYYKLLGLTRRATEKQIKKAYREKSLQYHPDKNKSPNAAEIFANLSRAYEVLKDDKKRSIYDKHGEEGLKRHEQGGGQQHQGHNPFDLFEQMFGGGSFQKEEEHTTETIQVQLPVELQDLYSGKVLHLQYPKTELCVNWADCTTRDNECGGQGIRIRTQQMGPFVQQFQTEDERCVMKGKALKRGYCRACPKGLKTTEDVDFEVEVTKGMRSGDRITMYGMAEEKPGMEPGDLQFIIDEKPHKLFKRDGNHLSTHRSVSLVDALTGFSFEMKHLDGHIFTVKVEGVTECNHTLRIPNKGMPRSSGHGYGDLYITFHVQFPKESEISTHQKLDLKKILGPGQKIKIIST